MDKFSWVITGVAIYFISVLLFLFVEETTFWDYYFSYVTLASCIFLGFCVFKKVIFYGEKRAIAFMIAYKSCNLIYLMIGDILGAPNRVWMEKHIAFFVVMGVAGAVAMLFTKKKNEEFN